MSAGKTSGPAAWTINDIRSRIGISTLCYPPEVRFGSREIAAFAAAGIRNVEICGFWPRRHFDYYDRAQLAEIKSACRNEGVCIVAIHGPNVPYSSEYPQVRRGAVHEAIAAAKVGEELGATIFIGHFDPTPLGEQSAREMLTALHDSPIKLTIENGDDLRDFAAFVDKVGSDRFGMVVDIGHARDADTVNPFLKKERARATMSVCGRRLYHLHLHDVRENSDHWSPFDGDIQWGEIFSAFRDLGYPGWLMFESASFHGPTDDIIRKVAAFPEAFIERYGR